MFVVILVVCSCAQRTTSVSDGSVRLRGKVDIPGGRIVVHYTGIAGDFGTAEDFNLTTDEDGNIDMVIPLNSPEYFIVSRNILYLSPGDDLTVVLTENHQDARFEGEGAAVNTFLSEERLYPKGGSFLEAGKNIKGDYPSTKRHVDSLAAASIAKLKALENVTEEFVNNEQARILANQANSYVCYAYYTKETSSLSADKIMEWREEFFRMIAQDVNPLMKKIAKDEYMHVKDVRDFVVSYLNNENFFAGIDVTPLMHEIKSGMECLSKLNSGTDEKTIFEQEELIAGFNSEAIRNGIQKKIDTAKKLFNGNPAIDIKLQDKEGKQLKLSDLKGKVLYVDFWATWCGPCLAEAPAFEELSKKYKGKDVAFVSISTDSSQEKWLKFLSSKNTVLPQYHTQDEEAIRDMWLVYYIPRFLLIDKTFNIANAYAPRPSSGEEIETEINKLL